MRKLIIALAAIAYFGGLTTDTAAAARAHLATAASGEVTITWPERICDVAGLELDQEWDLVRDPLAGLDPDALTEPLPDIVPEEIDGDPEAAWPTVKVAPWRADYHPDGSIELWHDARCAAGVNGGDVLIDPLDADAATLARAHAASRHARARAVHSHARRRSYR